MDCDILIENAVIVTINPDWQIIESGYIEITGDIITKIGEGKSGASAKKTINGRGKAVIPGFVNTHTHIPMAAFKGAGEDIHDRLKKYIFPMENSLVTPDLVFKASRFCLAEMVLSGTTTFADMYYFEEEVARATREFGMRAVLGQTITNFPVPDAASFDEGLARCRRFIQDWSGDTLITPSIAPHAPYSAGEDQLKMLSREAEKLAVPIMMHCAEMADEDARFKESHGSVIRYLDSFGFLQENLLAAHLIFVDDHDIELLAKRGVGAAHCPVSNAKGGRPISPAWDMQKAGVKLGLATDGPLSGNGMDMQGVLINFPKMQKMLHHRRDILTAREALRTATLGGAEAMGLDKEIGSLEAGKKADLAIIDADDWSMQPVYDWYSALVYAMRPHNVESVIVNGKMIVENRNLVTVNSTEIKEDMHAIRKVCQDKIAELNRMF